MADLIRITEQPRCEWRCGLVLFFEKNNITHILRDRTAVETAYSIGLHMSEVLALKVSDIDCC